MKIGELARSTGVSVDTLRFYEKQGLLAPPSRNENGYRHYNESHLARVRFVRSAQALGFTLTQIGEILPHLAQGGFGRTEIERCLQAKLAEIDAQILALQGLKQQIEHCFTQLSCAREVAVSDRAATLPEHGVPQRIKRLHGR